MISITTYYRNMNSRKGDTVLREVCLGKKYSICSQKTATIAATTTTIIMLIVIVSIIITLYTVYCHLLYIILTISIPVLTRVVSNSRQLVVGFQTPLTLPGFCGQSNNPHAIGPFHERIARGVGFQASQFHFHRALGHCPDFRSHKKVTWIFWSILNEEIP